MAEDNQEEKRFSFKNYFIPLTTFKAIHWIILIGLVVYCNGLFNNFVGDDLGQIVDNPLVHSLGNIIHFFSGGTFYSGTSQNLTGIYYRPLYLTYFAIVYSIFGVHAFLFHSVQLVFHISNSILVFFIFKRFFKHVLAFFLSLIFLVHPINSETVFYISDAQDILFFFFGIISLLVLTRYQLSKALLLSCLFIFFAFLAKETGLLFLLLTIAYVFLFSKKNILHIVLLYTTTGIFYILLRIHAIGLFTSPSGSIIAQVSLSERILTIPAIFLYYLKTFIFPMNLASSYQWVYHDVPHIVFPTIIDLLFLSIVFLTGFIICKKSPHYLKTYLFFTIWFFLGILFHMQIIPLDQTVAERWFYFPSVGLLGMIAVVLVTLKTNVTKMQFICIGILILVGLSTRTVVRSFDWRDEFTIASHDLRVSPEAYGLENELSYAYFIEGNFKNAKIYAEKSIQLFPYRTNYLNLGAADFSLGDYQAAKTAFLKAIDLGDTYQAYDNLAFLSLSYGDPKKDIQFIKNIALKKNPTDGKLWLCLAALEYNYGNKQEAAYEIQEAYTYDQEQQVVGVYNAIVNNEPVKIGKKK